MKQELSSYIGMYLTTIVFSVIGGVSTMIIHNGFKRLEGWMSQHLSPTDAAKVNEMLRVIDQLTEFAVQDANSRVVLRLKTNGKFTPEMGEEIKQAVIQDVIKNLGPLREKAGDLVGPLENIIGHAIEKHVLAAKPQMRMLIHHAREEERNPGAYHSPKHSVINKPNHNQIKPPA